MSKRLPENEKQHKAKVKQVQNEYHANLPDTAKNENHVEDFESLLLKAVTTIEPKRKGSKHSRIGKAKPVKVSKAKGKK
jgi:hypothetical protein